MCDRGDESGVNARWQYREEVRERVRSAPNDRGLRRALQATTKQLKRTRAEAVQRYLENILANSKGVSETVINLAVQTPQGDAFGRKEDV